MKLSAQTAFNAQYPVAFRLRLKPLAAIAFSMMACGAIPQAMADVAASTQTQTQTGAVDEVSFDNTYLRGEAGSTVDTSRFTRGNAVTPGTYSVDLIVNGARLAREDIRFVSTDGKPGSKPCFSRALLQSAGVDLAKADAAAGRGVTTTATTTNAETCDEIGTVVPGATVDFDFTQQTLELSVPQAFMKNSARGYVPPEQWDQGVNGGFLSYNANTYHTEGSG
ncbi:MAG: Fimbrial biosis outer rane usher protein, partial [Caballeronia sp.]|uniref:FimD/PapC N-terminal domain-containing protein n=1 Tax=Caballeronia sp. TaxID=1931223 RepID=UPI00260C2AFB